MIMNTNSLKKVLVLVAIVFALLAAVAGSPYKISILPISTSEEFEIEGKLVKVIDAQELAKWIMDKRDNFHLVDTRIKNEFNEYYIPFALNIPPTGFEFDLMESKKSIIIYDQSNRYLIEKLKPLINNRNEEVYVLKGGMDKWIDEILFPDLREKNYLSEEEIKNIYKTSTYFGGKPILDKERPKRKYKREGC
jgi:rhodanese-related sulfurtransferase